MALTIAGRGGIDLTGMSAVAEMEISEACPRRIASIKTFFTVPASVPEDILPRLASSAELCPIHNSFHPDTKVEVRIARSTP